MADASRMAGSDDYYRSPIGRRAPDRKDVPWRCGCTGEWVADPPYGCHPDPEPGTIQDFRTVRWVASSGNLLEYHFDHKSRTVRLLVDSARHGIPICRLATGEIWAEPDEVIRYETTCHHWKWWETLDDHPQEREAMSERFGWPELAV